jgi:hypothetical protein
MINVGMHYPGAACYVIFEKKHSIQKGGLQIKIEA